MFTFVHSPVNKQGSPTLQIRKVSPTPLAIGHNSNMTKEIHPPVDSPVNTKKKLA